MSDPTPSRPFVRGPFASLPDQPRRPHTYFSSPARQLRMASATFGALDVHYREVGDPSLPPLLLIHGLMTTSYSWRYILDDLARDFRVIAPDLPGCGRTGKPLGPRYSAAALAAWVIEFTDALHIRGCRVVGNSMGGYLCMHSALADPSVFQRLVNIHSPGVPDGRHHALHAALAIPGLRGLLAWWVRRDPHRWVHRNVHYRDDTLKSLEETREYGDPMAASDGARAFVKYLYETFRPADQQAFVDALAARREAAQPFPVPLLLLYSRQDPLVPPSVGVALQRLVPQARLQWLDDTSHFAHVDTPAPVVAALRDFLLP